MTPDTFTHGGVAGVSMQPDTVREQLALWATWVDAELDRRIPDPDHASDGPTSLDGFIHAIRYSLLAPGKRIRPSLVMAAAQSCGLEPRSVVRVAAAFEVVHAYSLVHDDLPSMDDDDMRRGRPTSHRQFGEATAILVGDALQAEGFAAIVSDDSLDATVAVELTRILARSVSFSGMVGGQYLDVCEVRGTHDAAALRDLHDRKTGALLAACVEAGAVLGGHVDTQDPVRLRFASLGRGIGWLFQLVDDLLDATGDPEVTGKSVGIDERHSKVTAVSMYGIDGAQAAADAQLAQCLSIARHLPAGGMLLPDIARFVRHRDR